MNTFARLLTSPLALSRDIRDAVFKSTTFLGNAFSHDMDRSGHPSYSTWFDTLNLQWFSESLYIFIGVSMIRETVSGIPLEMYRILNADGDVDEVTDDPWIDLFETPNAHQTQKEFWKLALSYYLLTGEDFWYLEGVEKPGDIPTAKVNIRPDNVTIVLSEDKREIIGYEIRNYTTNVLKLRPEEMLHIKNPDPSNPLRGIGILKAASQRIIAEQEVARYQVEAFKNSGRPDIAVFVDKEEFDEDEAKESREKWDKIYGKKGGAKAGFFGNVVKDIKTLSTTPKEMEGRESMVFLRDDMLAALRIPKQMIDPDVNYANSEVAFAIYIRNACQPPLDAFIDAINNRLMIDAFEDRFYTYESPAKDNRELILKEAVQLKKAGIITPNEARDLLNYEPMADGDAREEATGNTMELSMSMKRRGVRKQALKIIKKRKVLNRKFAAIRATRDMILLQDKGVRREQNPVFNTKAMKEKYIKAYNDRVDGKADKFLELIEVRNDGLARRVIKHLEEFGLMADGFLNVPAELNEQMKIFVPFMRDLYTKAGQEVLDDVAKGFEQKATGEQFFTSEAMLAALEARAEFFVSSMLDTDFKAMQSRIIEGMEQGLGVDEIARNLRKYFADMSVGRAKTIARTETGRLVSQATQEAYSQSAVITGKEWMTAGDEKVRPEHVMNNGIIVSTDAAFPNGEHYPGESTINCRCAIAPAV